MQIHPHVPNLAFSLAPTVTNKRSKEKKPKREVNIVSIDIGVDMEMDSDWADDAAANGN